MSTATDESVWYHNGDGTTKAFAYTNKVLGKGDLEVHVGGALKTVDVDYTVTGLGAAAGGTVAFGVAPPAGKRNVAIERITSGQSSAAFKAGAAPGAGVLSALFDRVYLVAQEALNGTKRSLRVAAKDWSGNSLAVVPVANRVLAFDAKGNLTTENQSGVWRGAWATATAYKRFDQVALVSRGNNVYVCLTDHTSDVFATDLAAGRWQLVIDVRTVSRRARAAASSAADARAHAAEAMVSAHDARFSAGKVAAQALSWEEDPWSPGRTYAKNAAVYYQGSTWRSLVDGNRGNNPKASSTQWTLLALAGNVGDLNDLRGVANVMKSHSGAGPFTLSIGQANVHRLHNLTFDPVIRMSFYLAAAREQVLRVYLFQDATARRPIWPAQIKWEAGREPDLSAANRMHCLEFVMLEGGWQSLFGFVRSGDFRF